MGGYDPKGREIVAAFARVMRHLGTSFGVLRKEKCTGDPVRRLGNDLVFQQLAESNLEILEQSKVKKIVTICPHCVRTIQEDWKAYGTPPPIEHHSEFLARYADQLPQVQDQKKEKIVFHDPCYLGRYRNVYDEPRAVAATAGQVIDPPRARERSFCCGAGGGLVFLGEETGERVSHVRAQELVATGAVDNRHRLPVLQFDVSRCAVRVRSTRTATARHSATRRPFFATNGVPPAAS